MSYEPTVWKKGDVVTSEKLNKIEQGVADISKVFDPTLITCEVTVDGTTVTTTNMGQICAALRAVVENPAIAPFYTAHVRYVGGDVIGVFTPYIDDDGNICAICGASQGNDDYISLFIEIGGDDDYIFGYSMVSDNVTFVEDDLEEDGSYVVDIPGEQESGEAPT